MMYSRRFASALATIALCSSMVGAVPIVVSDNTANPPDFSDTATGAVFLGANFNSGPAGGSLVDIVLLMHEVNPGGVLISIFSDNAGVPGAPLVGGGLVSPGVISGTPGTATTFTPSGLLNLGATTNFWVVMQALGAGEYRWQYPTTATGTGAGFVGDYAASMDAGGNWFNPPGPAYQMRVRLDDGLPAGVPELDPAGTLLPLGLAIGILLLADGGRRLQGRHSGSGSR